MIIFSVREEIRIIIYLLSYGITVLFLYDTLLAFIKNKNIVIQYIIKITYSVLLIYGSYLYAFDLKGGYIPQYAIIIIGIGIFIYSYFLQEKTRIILDIIISILNKITNKFQKIFLPFKIFKKTFLGFKKKMFKKNIKTLYK